MEENAKATLLTVAIVIILLIAVVCKIKSDRKRKSMFISSAGQGSVKNVRGGIKPGGNKDLWGIPGWVLALMTMFLAFVVLIVVGELITAVFRIEENDLADFVFYIIYNLIIAAGCFLIVRKNPKSIWYVPLLTNLAGIFSSVVETNFWTGSLWVVICSGWVLSVIASLAGVYTGKKKVIK